MTDCKQYIIAHFGRRFYKNYFKACHGRALALFLHGVMFRSSHQRCSMKKDVLRNFSEFTGKHLCHSLCLGLQLYLKKRLQHRCFLVKFEKFLRTPFLQNRSGRLLLYVYFIMVNVLHLSIFHRNFITRIWKNGILAASDYCLHNQLTFYNFIRLGESLNKEQVKVCFFQQVLRQNVS